MYVGSGGTRVAASRIDLKVGETGIVRLPRMKRDPSTGASAQRVTTEYVLILAAVVIVIVVACTALGTTMAMMINGLVRCLEQTRMCR